MMTAEGVAEALGGKRNGSGWMCHCPAHEDRTPSLSIAEGDGGKILARCHAGCDQATVIAELRERGLWPTAERKSPPARPQAAVAPLVWIYTTESGEPVLRVTRFETANGKTFSQSVPDGTGWRFGGLPQGAARPLYGLPLPPDPAVVVVTEGEKKRDYAVAALQHLPSFTVTCWPGGASNARHVDLAPLQGRVVVLWPDADPQGIQAMATVAQRLDGIAKAVHVVDVADLPHGHDAADLEPGEVVRRVLAAVQSPAAESSANPKSGGASGAAEQPRPLPAVSRCLADLTPERVRWLWPGRIAKGKVTMLAGHPGLGKSQVTASLAAIVTTGGQWPVDRHRAERGAVVILSAEDDAADTILPRMLAAGADTRRVHVLDAVRGVAANGETCERTFDLTRDIGALAALLDSIEGAALVVIDPVTAYMGGVDSHRNAEVRGMLAPLSDMAARYGVAVLGVSHLNKSGGGDALMRVTGSLAFVAAARAAWLVAKDPGDAARRLFLPMKNNIGPDATGLAFRIESATVADGIETSLVVWDGEPVTMAANEALDAEGRRDEDSDAPQRGEAESWLRHALDAGPVASEDLKRMARDDGMSWRTVERAKKSLGVVAGRDGFGRAGRWEWQMPEDIDRHHRPPRQNDVAVYGESEAASRYAARVSPKTATATGLGGLCADGGGLSGLEMGGAGCTTVEGEL